MRKSSLLFLLPATSLLADDATSGQGNLVSTLIMIGMFVIFFYFILWRPEQKRRKAAEEMRKALKKGDKVTAMGIIGRIDRITDTTVILKMVDGTKIEVLKGAITDAQSCSDIESCES